MREYYTLLILCIFLIFILCLPNTHIENFDAMCSFQADVGKICPIHIITAEYTIQVYQNHEQTIQEELLSYLQDEWNNEDTNYTHQYIVTNWPDANAFYIMTNTNTGSLIGSIAVDRKNFLPFISNLYILPEYRKKGYASVLLQTAEDYIKSMGFTEAHLWCKESLITYYQKRGYEIENSKNETKIVMVKYL